MRQASHDDSRGEQHVRQHGQSKVGHLARAAACLWFALGSVAASHTPQPASPLIGPQTTVVLLAGLPGDVESENNERDQMQTWLDFVQTAGPVREMFVLCDFQESLHLPASNQSSPVRVSPANRDAFLGLTQSLAGRTNDMLFVIWGHGGTQHDTPVFHVRGPRLTPADFKAVGEAAPRARTRWVLMFRGSGGFATELAGEERQILSSEHDTIFASDPIGMSLLLKSVRAKPDASFEALSEGLGHAVAAWYKERNLARTEDPAFWSGTEKPRLLAEAEEATSFASTNVTEGDGAGTNHSTNAVQSAREALPAAWKEIKRAEPQEYPEADAVVLRRRVTYTLGSAPAVASEQDDYIQILTPEGKRYGDFDISYSPPAQEINFLDCEVLGSDGKLTTLDPDEIREGTEQAVGDYHPGQRKYFSLPGVGPGAILHVRYRTEWREFPLPHVSLAIPVGGELPVREATLQISVPKDAPFHFAFDPPPDAGHAWPDPDIKQGGYGTTYSWSLQRVPAEARDVLMPPGESLRLLVSTFADWPDFARWYGRMSELADEVTPEIAAKTAELTASAKTDRDKVMAVYNYVTRLRYVAVPLGVNSFRPHAAANVLQHQFGDCKDKANLFNALLHATQIQAHLVLVPRFSQAHQSIPGLAFNHAISRVTLGANGLWVDTTDDICRFGMLPPGDPGRNVLVVDGENGALTELPAPEPKDHLLKISGRIDCPSTGTELPAAFNAVALGYPDYELREAARSSKEMGSSLPLLERYFHTMAGAFALEKQTATSVAALDESFAWQAQGSCLGLVSMGPGPRTLQAPFWLPKEWELALHHRGSRLFLNQGYPLTLEETFDFNLEGSARPDLPGLNHNDEGPLRWRIEWTQPANDSLRVLFRVELERGELTASETPVFQRQLRGVLSAAASRASFGPK